MVKRRGSPDPQGMGAQSDFLSESFIPTQQQAAQRSVMAQSLRAIGVPQTKSQRCSLQPLKSCSPVRRIRKSFAPLSLVDRRSGHTLHPQHPMPRALLPRMLH